MSKISDDSEIMIAEIAENTTLDGFFDLACKIAFLYQEMSEEEKRKFVDDNKMMNTYLTNLQWAIFNNDYFIKVVTETIREEKNTLNVFFDKQKIQKNAFLIERRKWKEIATFESKQKHELFQFKEELKATKVKEKQLIQIVLYTSAISIIALKEHLPDAELIKFGKQFNYCINKILQNQEHEFGKNELVDFLSEINFDYKYHYNKDFDENFGGKLKSEYIFSILSSSRDIVGSLLHTCSQDDRVAKAFKKVSRLNNKDKNYKMHDIVHDLSTPFKVTSSNINEYLKHYGTKNISDNFLSRLIKLTTSKTTENAFFVLSKMTLPLRNDKGGDDDLVSEFINKSSILKDEIKDYFRSNFSVFKIDDKRSNDWSNKLFLVSIKSLAIFEQISEAKDQAWKYSVFTKEYSHWLHEVNNILNKHNIEDDWEIVKKYLVSENTKIEWKSSFLTSTQDEYTTNAKEKELSEIVLSSIIKPIIGMMNTDGGTILVGIVENPEKVIRRNVKDNLHTREHYTLFDINSEFKTKNTDLDQIKRSVQDKLMVNLQCTADKFNNLISFTELEVVTETGKAIIIKIDIDKSSAYFYSISTNKDKVNTYCLYKRADGRTIKVKTRSTTSLSAHHLHEVPPWNEAVVQLWLNLPL
jgi:hypothetical protein